MCMRAQFEEGGGFFDCVVRSVWNAICRDGFFAADSRLIVAVLRSLARRPGKRSVFLIRPKSLALAHAAVELPRFESAGGTRRFSEGNSDRGTPPSLPPWGRWQPEGLTDEVVYRNPPPLLIPFVLFAVSHVGTAFCGGFPPDCRHAALTPALLHSASAGFGRRSQMRAPSVRLCRTLQRLAIARLPGDAENVLFSCSGQNLALDRSVGEVRSFCSENMPPGKTVLRFSFTFPAEIRPHPSFGRIASYSAEIHLPQRGRLLADARSPKGEGLGAFGPPKGKAFGKQFAGLFSRRSGSQSGKAFGGCSVLKRKAFGRTQPPKAFFCFL